MQNTKNTEIYNLAQQLRSGSVWYANNYAMSVVNSDQNQRKGIYAEYTFGSDGNFAGQEIKSRIDAFFKLSGILKKPIALISSPPPGAGGHWVFMYFIDDKNLLYANPFGYSNTNLENAIKELKKSLYTSTAKIQTDGSSCGPISTELAMHFQDKYFLNSDELVAHLVQSSQQEGSCINKVDIKSILSDEIKNCESGDTNLIRIKHYSIKEKDGFANPDALPVNNLIDFLVEDESYYSIDEKGKKEKLDSIKDNILSNISDIERQSTAKSAISNIKDIICNLNSVSDWRLSIRGEDNNDGILLKCVHGIQCNDKKVNKYFDNIKDKILEARKYVDQVLKNRLKNAYCSQINKINNYIQTIEAEIVSRSQNTVDDSQTNFGNDGYLDQGVAEASESHQSDDAISLTSSNLSEICSQNSKAESGNRGSLSSCSSRIEENNDSIESISEGKNKTRFYSFAVSGICFTALSVVLIAVLSVKNESLIDNKNAQNWVFSALCASVLISVVFAGLTVASFLSTKVQNPQLQQIEKEASNKR
jgi:hypothetical protein